MFCKYCGNRLEDGDRFCGACGHPVEEKPMQETANEDSYKKQEEKVPRIKKKKPEPEYDNRMTEGMGYGYQMEQHQEDDDDEDEEEWEREEKKEKITFAILGIIIVVLVVAIVFGVVKLVGAGSGDTKKVPQLNEQMKEDMQKIQDRDEKDTEEIAGYVGAYLAADELSITNVAVFSSYRRCGAANQLMKALDAFAQEKNLYGITLEVRVSNNAAIALYEKNGYEKSGIRKGFYSKPKEDALIMWKYFQQ